MEFAGALPGQFLKPVVYEKVVMRVVSLLQWPSIRFSDDPKSQLSQGTQTTWNFLQPAQCACADDLAVLSLSLRGFMIALIGIRISFCGFHCWPQCEVPQMLLGSVWQRRA